MYIRTWTNVAGAGAVDRLAEEMSRVRELQDTRHSAHLQVQPLWLQKRQEGPPGRVWKIFDEGEIVMIELFNDIKYPAMKPGVIITIPKHIENEHGKLIIDNWKCPCCHTAGFFEYTTEKTLRCRNSGLFYNWHQMKEIQGTGWVGEEK
jgi:hypothetical protein